MWSPLTHANVASGFGWAATAAGTTRAEKVSSCLWRISLATSAEETTMVVSEPSCRVMRGPCVLASSASDWLGFEPSSNSEPIIGRPVGPGGSFLDSELMYGLMMNQKNEMMKMIRMESSIFGKLGTYDIQMIM